jgi:predicted TIM-barrel fold metal-dependent hydrolase
MKVQLDRRTFLGSMAALPWVLDSELGAQAQIPIIDTHIHMFDKARHEGSPYPGETSQLGKNFQSALPPQYKQITAQYGVVGAIIIEAGGPRLEDNQWWLNTAASDPVILGVIGRLDPASSEFGKNVERFHKDKLFLGIRQSNLDPALDKPDFVANLKILADAGLVVDAIPGSKDNQASTYLKTLDKVPNLRLILEHYPNGNIAGRASGNYAKLPAPGPARDAYLSDLRTLAKRPNVFAKYSEVVKVVDDKVSADVNHYKEFLDLMWDIFGEDRIMFGSDWPQSENMELGSYPNVIAVAKAYMATKTRTQQEKVWWRNSLKAYRWQKRAPNQPRA